ncbi:hypothetical protein OF83DRAFT_934960 [Amylostereum chailletii]|nr:hypothetical protein OF83DRAFT_934960 [Amylostereum chailletii]
MVEVWFLTCYSLLFFKVQLSATRPSGDLAYARCPETMRASSQSLITLIDRNAKSMSWVAPPTGMMAARCLSSVRHT